jgi:manganese oxidase
MSAHRFALLAAAAATLLRPAAPSRAERARPNDNRVAAGRLAGGVLTVHLEARAADWFPEGERGAALPLYAFAEAGQHASVPGPMIRVSSGTDVRVTVRNALPKPLRLRGLQERISGALDSVVIAPGATTELRFRADVPGSYYYWGRTEPIPATPVTGRGSDAPLVGAFIVDPAGTMPPKGERVLVISGWADSSSALGIKSDEADLVMRRELLRRKDWIVFAVNGGSWPHTERLSYSIGDTVRWRVINTTRIPHPMHLHGFYFDVEARGDVQRDTAYDADTRRSAVTEWMVAGSTMTMSWVPTRAGNWLFHCHLVPHMSDALRLPAQKENVPTRVGDGHAAHMASAPAAGARAGTHAEHAMGGLVMGIQVSPLKGATPVRDARPRRRLRLFVTERANVYGNRSGFGYVLQEGALPPAADSIPRPSSTITLRQHEPVEIAVINASTQATAVHWHGLELESFYDGVGDWSGWAKSVAPPVAPGDSFIVRFTPPRAGTFIYHTHADEGVQLASGLYGALVVLPANVPADTTDRLFLLGLGGPLDDSRPVVNGWEAPPLMEIRSGVAHRFRVINISPLETHSLQLVSGNGIEEWRPVAKDGADLPSSQAKLRRATVVLHPGETYDFEVLRQHPESLTVRVLASETIANRAAFVARSGRSVPQPRIVIDIPLRVK